MIKISQIKVPVTAGEEELEKAVKKRLNGCCIRHWEILKQSLDARKHQEICWVYTVVAEIEKEQVFLKKNRSKQIEVYHKQEYRLPECGREPADEPPVIVGSGPAGLFCALALAEKGFCPVIVERGKPVEERMRDVETFWETGSLVPESNVQFGEGGAGTFSDGKLNTLVKDPSGRNQAVLDYFVTFGANPKIRYVNKPHIGTDVLVDVLKNIRARIVELGGRFLFSACMTDIIENQQQLEGILLSSGERLYTKHLILAIGHSARDTFEMLYRRNLTMEPKSFAVGFRVEHPQVMINRIQYGDLADECGGLGLPTAAYKVTVGNDLPRGVYSFCMCPGGYVVNASSEPDRLAVNGMSYSSRDGENANSAIIVSVTPEDFPDHTPLGGVKFQRGIEERAFRAGGGKVPQQLFGDFEKGVVSTEYGAFSSCIKGQHTFANCRGILPEELNRVFIDGMHKIGEKIEGFDREDAILSGIESRTSSPVRIVRDERLQSNVKGIYPCGEGAGYAGGIMSAAMDGLKVAEYLISNYHYTKR